ncbi:MAG: ornithine cyclodeaminase family protein [Geminicoccaceae bacterium]
MRIATADDVRAALAWPDLVEALRHAFVAGCEAPVRHHHTVPRAGQPDAVMLLMPAWQAEGFIGVKLVTVFPGNADRDLAAVNATYMLFDGDTGAPLASIDGGELTARRTAAASALAADYLARKDASTLLLCATGRLSTNLAEAHAAVRPIKRILVHGRSRGSIERTVEALANRDFEAVPAGDLEAATRRADIISCATLSTEPIVRGDWLMPGVHVDLVGAFTPTMRESDDAVFARADLVAVDTREGALKEAGDIVQATSSGALAEEKIAADLFRLTRGSHPGRAHEDQITVFKSVGTALEDLAAAILVHERAM